MAIARCKECSPPKTRAGGHIYELAVHPLGYPNTASICGIKGCENPSLIWLNLQDNEKDDYEAGRRIFGLKTNSTKVKVSDFVEYRKKNG